MSIATISLIPSFRFCMYLLRFSLLMGFHEIEMKRHACKSKGSVSFTLNPDRWELCKLLRQRHEVHWIEARSTVARQFNKLHIFIATYFYLSAIHHEINCININLYRGISDWKYIFWEGVNISFLSICTTNMETVILRFLMLYKSLHSFMFFVRLSE